jgi:membrane-associated phospholipid phosphatase
MRRAILLGAAFAVLTAAVQVGLLRPADRFANDHLQPLSDTTLAQTVAPAEPMVALRPIVRGHRSLGVSIAAIAFAPADTLSAVILVSVTALALRRRGRPRAGAAWIVALGAGLVIEGAGKRLVDQIQTGPVSHVFGVTFRGSYPSGHTIRSVILAALVSTLWPRARPWVIVWVVFVTGVLELGGLHVPTDIAGGFLAGGALACAAIAYSGRPTRAGASVLPVQSGGDGPAQAPRPADVQAPSGATNGGGRRPGADRGEEQPKAR